MRPAILFVLFCLFAMTPVGALAAPDPASRLPVTGDLTEPEPSLFEDAFAEEETLKVRDPLEPVNRGIFWFNDKLYFYLFKPIARGLRVVPEPARVSLGNFFDNLAAPVRFANKLLQLKPGDASDELARFIFNSTFGIAGLFDIAKEQGGVRSKDEDFGQTLGHYGAGPGFYLVLPLLGPSNARDAVGRVGDYFLDPLTYNLGQGERIAGKVIDRENALSLDKDTYEGIVRDELDPYLFVRNAYTQRRQALIAK
jgi:phospholipid-binding lipoprotein MlaA